MLNVASSNARIERFAIRCIIFSPTKIPTDISTFSQSLSGLTIKRFTRRRAWRRRDERFGLPRDMEE